jgi:hypothetical protein
VGTNVCVDEAELERCCDRLRAAVDAEQVIVDITP